MTSFKDDKRALARPSCFECREPVLDRDYAIIAIVDDYCDTLKAARSVEVGSRVEVFYCTGCALKRLSAMSYGEAEKQRMSLRWVGKTWSFEIPLYEKRSWKAFSEGLKAGALFPKDSLLEEEKAERPPLPLRARGAL
jgi:hypothetical protein